MRKLPDSVSVFLSANRIAVAGVSRDPNHYANAIFRRLRDTGHDVVPVNPHAAELEGVPCYPDLMNIPGEVDSLMVATPPDAAFSLVRQCGQRGIKQVWFHRSIGAGSVSQDAVEEAKAKGITCLVGGCPLMYCEPVDVFHRCMRVVLHWRHRAP
ncbi:MAG: CoA-binding protein [Bacteroidota bacterium]